VEIRNPDKTHLSAVFSLFQGCFPGAWTGAELEDRIFFDARYDPNHVWMAREQGRVLGLLVSVQDGPLAWLKLVAVDESARRRGLGRDLLSRAEFRLAGEGVRELRIEPTPPREFLPGVEADSAAVAFFEAEGFRASGSLEARWVSLPALTSTPAPEVDRQAAAAFAREHCGADWPWIEEQLSWRPARAAFEPGVGLCLADPGFSLGPLWPAPAAKPDALITLAQAALGVALSAPTRRPEGLRLWRVESSMHLADWGPLADLPVFSRTYNTYSKALL
jgi:GNAT superfamily N-acetyltransferase